MSDSPKPKPARHTIRVDFSNGDHLITDINGTEGDIRAYYIGNPFNLGTGGNDLMVTATAVDFIDTDHGPVNNLS